MPWRLHESSYFLKDPQLQERGEELVVELAAIDRLSLTGMINPIKMQEDQLICTIASIGELTVARGDV